MPTILDQSLSAVKAIEESHHGKIISDLGRRAFETCLAELNDLKRGHYFCADDENSSRSLILPLTASVRRTMLVTLSGEDITWWLSPSSSRATYWRLNKDALNRGVSIRRIFIYQDWTDDLEALANEHLESGVEVLRVARSTLSRSLQVTMTIWDDECALEFKANSAGELFAQEYTFAEQDIHALTDRFKVIEAYAEPWSGGSASTS